MAVGKRRSTLFELLNLYNSPALFSSSAWIGGCWLCDAAAGPCGLCGRCRADLPRRQEITLGLRIAHVDRTFAPFRYAFPLNRMIQRAKFHRDLAAMHTLACLIRDEVSDHLLSDAWIVPVPLPALRYTGRGFNQAMELARPLAALNGCRIASDAVRRIREGPPQSSLPASARRGNVNDAFEVCRPVSGETIVIMDDVVTTGATLSAVAAALRRAGAAGVYAMAAAAAHAPG